MLAKYTLNKCSTISKWVYNEKNEFHTDHFRDNSAVAW